MINKFIRNFVAKMVAGRSDDGIMITLKDPKKVDFQSAMMEDFLMRNGIDPNAIQSEDQLKMILNRISSMNQQNTSGIRNTESAKVFNTAGEELDPSKPIVGGTQEGKKINQEFFIRNAESQMPPPGSRGGANDEESLKNMIVAENKKNIAAMKNRKKRPVQRESLEDFVDDAGGVDPDDPRSIDDFIPDPEEKADGGRIGFFMGSKFPKGLATLREMVKFFSKGKDKERSGSEILRMVNPKQFNKLLEDPRIYDKFDVQKGIGAPELIKNMQADQMKNRTMMIEEILSAAKNIRKSDVGTMERKNEIIKEMIERGIDRETAGEMADTMVRMAEATVGKRTTPKLTDEGILELENVLKNMETGGKKKRDLNADGGRIGLKDGMNRRTFLKLLGGLASIPIVGKVFKPLKTVKGVKNVPIIKTGDVPGKPEWFDQLVNKVIIEGDDVTKRFATQERQVVHMKKIDDETTVTVTQDLNDGSIMVDVDDPIRNVMGESGQDTSVQMMLKKGQADETTKGTPADEFSFTENDMRNYMDGPDDFTTEAIDNTVDKMSELTSDLGKLKSYATGKKPTMKEFIESKKRKDMVKFAERNPSEYAANRGPDIDYSDYDDGMASGGIAGMLGE